MYLFELRRKADDSNLWIKAQAHRHVIGATKDTRSVNAETEKFTATVIDFAGYTTTRYRFSQSAYIKELAEINEASLSRFIKAVQSFAKYHGFTF